MTPEEFYAKLAHIKDSHNIQMDRIETEHNNAVSCYWEQIHELCGEYQQIHGSLPPLRMTHHD